jgi:hypothetical protein
VSLLVPLSEAPARVGPDLWALAAGLGAAVVETCILTSLPSPVMAHASFRLRLADGRTVKGRRVETPDQAGRIAELLARLDRRHFSRVLAREGIALLEKWWVGTPLDTAAAGPAVFRRCGRILGRVHTVPPPGAPAGAAPSAAQRLAVTERQLARLRDLGALAPAAARRALRQLRDHVPDRVVVGVVHRDFCAENIVLTHAGGIRVIDNETIAVDACELDLARTWYRWPMTRTERAAFLAGYGERRPAAAFRRHFPFWAIAALVDAALFRVEARTTAAAVPVRRLVGLLDQLERARGIPPPRPGRGVPPRESRDASAAARGGGSSPGTDGQRPRGARARARVAPRPGAARVAAGPAMPDGLPPHRRGFRYPGVTVAVASPDASHLAWLEEFLAPAFEVTDADGCDRWVVLDTDAVRYSSALARGPIPGARPVACFAMDAGILRHAEWAGGEPGERVLFDRDYEAFYRIDRRRGHVRVLASGRSSLTRVATMRVVRELAMTAVPGGGGLLLHGAALAIGHRGIVLAGPRRAGKTTLLLHALQAQGAAFVANDRVLARVSGRRVGLRGMPTVVTVRAETLAMFPAITARVRDGGYWHARTLLECDRTVERRLALSADGAATLTPAQLCRVTRVPPLAEVDAWRLVFPRVDATLAGLRLERLGAAAAARRLRAALFSAACPERVSEAFGAPRVVLDRAALHRRVSDLARRVPAYAARLGAGAYGGPEAVARLVADLARDVPRAGRSWPAAPRAGPARRQ